MSWWCTQFWNPMSEQWMLTPGELYSYTRLASPKIDVQNAAGALYGRGFDALTSLAELQKTIDMVTNFGHGLLAWLRKRQSPGADWDKMWMESRYGWRVFIYEMQDIAKAIDDIGKEERIVKEAAGRSHNEVFSETIEQSAGTHSRQLTIETDVDASTRGTVVAKGKLAPITFNPVLTAYELVTFSFVVDWFLDIGQAILATSLDLLTETQAGASWKIRVTKSCTITSVSWNTDCSGSIDYNSVMIGEFVRRDPCGIPHMPFLKVDLDIDKLRDLLSIFRRILSRQRR